jgi:rubrerythrin
MAEQGTDMLGGTEVEDDERRELDGDELIAALRALAELDAEAAAAYALGAQVVDDREVATRLGELGRDHLRHVRDLNGLIEKEGGHPIRLEVQVDRGLLLRLAETAALTGLEGLLVAMVGNEMLTNGTYRMALDLTCGEEVRAVLERNRADEQRHLRWLLDAQARVGVEFPAEPPAA